MARIDKVANAPQLFKGGYNALPVQSKFLGGLCCAPGVVVDYDRLPPTLQWENANVHTRPLGGRDQFVWAEVNETTKQEVLTYIEANGTDSVIEILSIPTFAFVDKITVSVYGEEDGLTFTLATRNGLVLPTAMFGVTETYDTSTCDGPTRAKDAAATFTGFGALDGATAKYVFGTYANAAAGFSLEPDVIQLKVASMPASGTLTGAFDLRVDVSYSHNGRSTAG